MTDREIERRLAKLDALEAGGVDNWEWYDVSLKEWHKESHVDECVEEAIESINDLLIEAEVDEPAGRDAGYSIDYNENKMNKILYKLIKDVNDG